MGVIATFGILAVAVMTYLKGSRPPRVYAERAGTTGGGNVDIELHNESNVLATNIEIELRQAGRKWTGTHPRLLGPTTDAVRKDLDPRGTASMFTPTGIEWTAICNFEDPDSRKWRSVRVSHPGNRNSTLRFKRIPWRRKPKD